eukprot:m.432237 g.432237  ORF g.432237 m.432237 type:complete len:683 (-) comp21407_c0_seq43:723-2771(-)
MEDDWIVDSVMGWLASPLWMVPIRTFVDNNCVIFDQEEEHKLEYTIIHMKFKELVESLLENFLSDIEISNDQFAKIMTSDIEIERDIMTAAVEILASADDYLLFRALMTQKNLELEAEVYEQMNSEMLASGAGSAAIGEANIHREGTMPPAYSEANPEPHGMLTSDNGAVADDVAAPLVATPLEGNRADEEDALIAEAMRLSREQYEREQREREQYEQVLQAVLEQSRLEWELLQQRLRDQEAAKQRALEASLKSTPKLVVTKASKKAAAKRAAAAKKKELSDPFARRGVANAVTVAGHAQLPQRHSESVLVVPATPTSSIPSTSNASGTGAALASAESTSSATSPTSSTAPPSVALGVSSAVGATPDTAHGGDAAATEAVLPTVANVASTRLSPLTTVPGVPPVSGRAAVAQATPTAHAPAEQDSPSRSTPAAEALASTDCAEPPGATGLDKGTSSEASAASGRGNPASSAASAETIRTQGNGGMASSAIELPKTLPGLRLSKSISIAQASNWVCESAKPGAAEADSVGPASGAAGVEPAAVTAAAPTNGPTPAVGSRAPVLSPEMEQRRKHFLQQRDRLRQQRIEAGQQQLRQYAQDTESHTLLARPPTAQAPAPADSEDSGAGKKAKAKTPRRRTLKTRASDVSGTRNESTSGEQFLKALSTRFKQECSGRMNNYVVIL